MVPCEAFDKWILETVTCQKLEAKILRYSFEKLEITN